MLMNTYKVADNKLDGKADNGKLRYDLVPVIAEEYIAKVLTMGAEKYGDNTWQGVPNGIERYYAALRRHLAAWRKGEKTDPESGLPHLAHVMVNAMFIEQLDKEDK